MGQASETDGTGGIPPTSTLYALSKDTCQGLRALDVGCGDGAGSRLLAGWGAAEVLGIDPSWDAIKAAESGKPLRGLRFIQADPSIPEQVSGLGSFDLIVCHQGMGTGQETAEILSGLRPLIGPGGALIASFACEGATSREEAESAISAMARPVLGPPNQVLALFAVTGWAVLDAKRDGSREVFNAMRAGSGGQAQGFVASWGTAVPESLTVIPTVPTPRAPPPARRRSLLARLRNRSPA